MGDYDRTPFTLIDAAGAQRRAYADELRMNAARIEALSWFAYARECGIHIVPDDPLWPMAAQLLGCRMAAPIAVVLRPYEGKFAGAWRVEARGQWNSIEFFVSQEQIEQAFP